MAKQVGFIGLGRMGEPMALRLIAAGYKLVVHDVRPEGVAALTAKGARAAGSPAEVAAAVDTVLLSLPTPPIVREVAAKVGTGKVKTVIDTSTIGIKAAEAAAAAARHKPSDQAPGSRPEGRADPPGVPKPAATSSASSQPASP